MARTGATTTTAAAAALLLLLALVATGAAAAAGAGYEMNAAPAAGGRARPAGLTQCVGVCGTTVASCLLDCYDTAAGGTLPICFLGCTNTAVFCATDCSTQAL
uniref:Acidic protein n=2 Tax=Hordeum vulgare TaxID=4513 RepID=A0A8I6WVV5_HORVV|nr:possible membrane protein LEM1 [Hordeum vulgare subsp. vulgare]